MLFGFYQLVITCRKYNFIFTLESEQKSRVEIIIRPLDVNCKITLVGNSYREVFKKAIYRIKVFRG